MGAMEESLDRRFAGTWAALGEIGRDRTTGGYRRAAWTPADLELRHWFADQAGQRGMACDQDRNGNQWAWWGTPAAGAVGTGSHLDSVPDGGAYDRPLGVVSGFLGVAERRARGVQPARPIAVVAFSDEDAAPQWHRAVRQARAAGPRHDGDAQP